MDLINLEEESQSPWTITVLEVDEDIADDFCGAGDWGTNPAEGKMLRMQKYVDEVATILFRYPGGDDGDLMYLEPSYLKSPTVQGIPGLYSMGLEARLFIHVSRRSALCICADMDIPPTNRFMNDLLNLCEIVRGRWHMLIMMNQVLDHSLRDMATSNTNIKDDEQQILSLRQLREWLSTALEDPGIYVIAGEFLSDLYQELEETFRIVELRKLVLDKLQLLEKIFRDTQEYRYLTRKIRIGLGE
jgi:hypothetical protein